jgi:N-acetylmuramoyl-L-alanine amidase
MFWMNSNDFLSHNLKMPVHIRRTSVLFWLYSALVFILLSSSNAYAGPQQDYLNARADFYTLLKSNEKQQYRHNWDKVLNPLQDFVNTYPKHAKTPAAYYLLGKAYTRLSEISHLRSDLEQAEAMFARLEQNFPRSSLADDAMLLRARLYQERYSAPAKAAQVCTNLLGRYPDGDMCSAAQKLLEQTGYTRSQLEREGKSPKPANTPGNALTDIRYSVERDKVRVVIETEAPARFEDASLKNPARVYVDIPGISHTGDLAQEYSVEHRDSVVQNIRLGHRQDTARIVCDLKRGTEYSIFTLDNPARIVMDIANSAAPNIKADTDEIREAPRAADDHVDTLLANAADGYVDMVTLPQQTRGNERLCIVVDPGHGGKDPGAVGANNLYEKDITLELSKRLAKVLRKHIDCDVHLTRTEDVYLTLQQRTAIANRKGADVFISVHANANVNKGAYGTETYFLNFSKNDKAVEVAARENDMSLREVGDLELILFDLMANSKINESSRLATDVQTSMINKLKQRFSKIRDLGVRQGPFYVLLGADMPSILVEAAFISNPREAKLLVNPRFQELTAEGIAQGVKAYLRGQNMVAGN